MFFHVSKLIQTFQTDWVESSTQSSLVIYNSCSTYYRVYFHNKYFFPSDKYDKVDVENGIYDMNNQQQKSNV